MFKRKFVQVAFTFLVRKFIQVADYRKNNLKMLKFIYFTLLINRLYAQTMVQILSEGNFSPILEQSNLTVTCQTTNLEGKTVRWSHNDREIALVANGDNIVFLDPNDRAKYSLRGGDSKGGNFTFTIHNVSVDDVGDITCEVNEITPKRYEIDVFKYPEKLFLYSNQVVFDGSQPSGLYVGFNTSLNLSCLALDSRPAANITWFINNTRVLSSFIEKRVVEKQGLYNTSSFLYLPPEFYRIFGSQNNELVVTTFSPNFSRETVFAINTFGNENKTKMVRSFHPEQHQHEDAARNDKKLSALVTCQAEIENELFSQSLLIVIGEQERSNSSSLNIFSRASVLLLFLVLIFNCIFL